MAPNTIIQINIFLNKCYWIVCFLFYQNVVTLYFKVSSVYKYVRSNIK